MIILGIETSCDDTAAALYDGEKVLSEKVSTQLEHREWGGVVPEIASRAHLRNIVPVVDAVLKDCAMPKSAIGAVGVTAGPGLAGALLVGLNFARGFTDSRGIPVIGVNHLQAHAWAAEIEEDSLPVPFIALIVSGGHTSLIRVEGVRSYSVLGQTLDDAAGEVLDKIGRLLGLQYPAGAEIDRIASGGNPKAVKLPRGMIASGDLNFSFSGLKTAGRLYLEKHPEFTSGQNRVDFISSLQEAVVDILAAKSKKAMEETGITTMVLGGGVSANSRLRHKFREIPVIDLRVTSPQRSTDNGAMTAHLAWKLLNEDCIPTRPLTAAPDLSISDSFA